MDFRSWDIMFSYYELGPRGNLLQLEQVLHSNLVQFEFCHKSILLALPSRHHEEFFTRNYRKYFCFSLLSNFCKFQFIINNYRLNNYFVIIFT